VTDIKTAICAYNNQNVIVCWCGCVIIVIVKGFYSLIFFLILFVQI